MCCRWARRVCGERVSPISAGTVDGSTAVVVSEVSLTAQPSSNDLLTGRLAEPLVVQLSNRELFEPGSDRFAVGSDAVLTRALGTLEAGCTVTIDVYRQISLGRGHGHHGTERALPQARAEALARELKGRRYRVTDATGHSVATESPFVVHITAAAASN